MAAADPFAGLSALARAWFEASFPAPTRVQREGWAQIAAGRHALLIAPTGSGKTLAAFLSCIDRLGRTADDAPGVRVVYVSPLKALIYDIERNLRAPLAGLERTARSAGEGACFRAPRVAVRTGDTSAKERRAQSARPAEILVTTPESLYLILGSRQRESLATVETVIVDEIHALAPSKRGAHLALSLERLAALAQGGDPQRIGLSATARPAEEVARFLGGDREVSIVDASERPLLDLRISVPVPDMTRPGADGSLWPALLPRLLREIRASKSAILFVNSRGLCERLAHQLNDLAGEALVRAHHGSLAHEQRREIEEALKAGSLRAIVATSSLELGIDMGAVELVVMVESPGSVARGLQRVGRAGHRVGEASRGLLLPKHRGDLLEAAVVARGMRRGEVEALRLPRNPLDVLAQQIVAMCGVEAWPVDVLESLVRRAAGFRELSRDALESVLDMLAGRYPSTDFAELRPRLLWDRERDVVEARRGARQLALVSGGTIPDRGLYAVHLGAGGPRIGELDEEMVNETRPGETLTLGASTWRVTEIGRDRVVVAPAPGEIGKLPFWRGEGPGRPIELGRALGAFLRELLERGGGPGGLGEGREQVEGWLRDSADLDPFAAHNLLDYLLEQLQATGALPSDRAVTVERFRDELGDWRICILSPFGARVHAPWALAIEARLRAERGGELQTLWSDDGIVLRFADADDLPGGELLLPEPEQVEELVVAQLGHSALFSGQFRENAARALLLPRRRPGARTPLWSQRLRAQNLLAVARGFPAFPIVLETYRSCLQDVFDLPGLVELLRGIREGHVRVDEVETRSASPFARSLVFAWTAAYLYRGDAPVAERRAQALTLDRAMLRDLLGHEDLRELLDASAIDETERALQAVAPERRARDRDALHDLLRRVGELAADEVGARCDGDATAWLAELEAAHRALRIEVGGEERFVAVEDAGLYRDALGAALPADLPAAFLAPTENALDQLVLRWARSRGPFALAALGRRYPLPAAQLEAALSSLEERGRLVAGGFLPGGREREWCDPEVLRRIRRRSLARLRSEVAPVGADVLARFLPAWQGCDQRGAGEARLDEVLEQLEGLPVSFAELERAILPARVRGFDPRMLDERGASGQWVWLGCGPLGDRDGRVALYRRGRVALLADPPASPVEADGLRGAVLAALRERGASFGAELLAATGAASAKALSQALWELAWAGLVTNDTFAPLRALSEGRGGRELRRAGRRPRRAGTGPSGRWSLAAPLFAPEPSPTARAHARATLLLERYGVLSRDAMALEAIAGGFAAVYPVLRAMEEAGRIRRGHFVAGYAGAQFALAGAVDRLRAARAPADPPPARLLAATDPANPYGALLPWPAARSEEARPRRAVGASVVTVGGGLALALDRGAHRLWTFPGADPAREEARLARAARALRQLFRDRRRRSVRIEEVDAEPAVGSPLREALVAAGFRPGYKGLELDRSDAAGDRDGDGELPRPQTGRPGGAAGVD
jgi:ATP-dependent Lhr-like helicase